MSRPSVQWNHTPIVGAKEKREGWWLATVTHAQLSGFVSNVLASPGNREEDGFVVKGVKLPITNQASKL